jgi:ABC-2 type transport system ATP-binding protein
MIGISSVQTSGDQLVLRADGGDPALAEAVKKLALSGVGIVGLEPERDQLEAVFLQLTKKDES